MSRFVIIIGLVCTASTARAEQLDLGRKANATSSEAQEDEARARMRTLEQMFQLTEMYLATDPIEAAQIDVSATLGGGFDVSRVASDASAQITAHLDSAVCQTLAVSLLVRGRTATSTDDRARASGEASVDACFPSGIDVEKFGDAPIPMTAFAARGNAHVALSKTPALTASRSMLREPYSEVGFSFSAESLRSLFSADRKRWIAVLGASLAQNWQWEAVPSSDETARLEIVLDMWLVRLHRRRAPFALADRSVDIFGAGAHGVRDDSGAAVLDFWPLRLSGVGLGSDYVLLDAGIGLSGVGELSGDNEIVTSNLPQVDIAAGHVALHIGTREASVSLGYDRSLDTNLLVELVHEDRGWIAGRRSTGRLHFDAGAFAGRARHYFDLEMRGDERLVGGSIDASYVVNRHLALGVAIAGTHSISRDAVLDGRVAGDGVRAMLTATTTHTLYQGTTVPIRSLRPEVLRKR